MCRWSVLVCCVLCVFLSAKGYSCQICPVNCATCFNATSCITCKSGFHSPSSVCISPCPTNCLEGICNETTGHCYECPKNSYGYICNLDCGLCKDEQCGLRKCTDGCKSGYWQYQDGEYFDCRACMNNCSSCEGMLVCDVCNDGTYRWEVSGSRDYCLLCRPGCVTCSSDNSCSACKPGYYGLTCQYKCSATILDCVLCNWDEGTTLTCIQCANGFTLQDNTCVEASQQCPNNCVRCTEDVCAMCKTGWYGELCGKPCHDIPQCVACQETDGSIVCNVCDVGYVVLDGKCSVSSTSTATVPPASSTPTSNTSAPTSIQTTTQYRLTSPSSKSTVKPTFQPASTTFTPASATTVFIAVPDYNTSHPQSQDTGFQTSTFVIGLVTGLGICACIILVVGLLWFFRRRRRLQKPATSQQNEPFYENSVTTNEPNPTLVSYHDPQPENIQQMRVVTENVSQSIEDNQQASVYEESVLTTAHIEQHEYTSMNVRQGEHIYKDLTAL